MRVSDFHFDLPDDLIAQHPPEVRGSSRMLVVERAVAPAAATLSDARFTDLPSRLQPGDLLVLNDSRVLPARLFATRAGLATQHGSPRPTGLIEVLLTEQLPHANENLWNALVRPARKVQPGETLLFPTPHSTEPALVAEVLAAGEFGERTLRFAPLPGGMAAFYETLARIGHMPLPPYIHRGSPQAQSIQPDSPEDRARYQTVYSRAAWDRSAAVPEAEGQTPGSAAAPTAGLHFTPEVLAALAACGVEIAYLTLHVGLGTFQPVRVSELADIRLHAEHYTLPAPTAEALNRALAEGRRIVAVGTTTTRTLEHLAQAAATSTWPPVLQPHSGQTRIFLAPGHRFRIVSGLLTNFHLPESTLLMLVAAFAGDRPAPGAPDDPDHGRRTILAAYAHAIRQRYRFYSYGDSMLLL